MKYTVNPMSQIQIVIVIQVIIKADVMNHSIQGLEWKIQVMSTVKRIVVAVMENKVEAKTILILTYREATRTDHLMVRKMIPKKTVVDQILTKKAQVLRKTRYQMRVLIMEVTRMKRSLNQLRTMMTLVTAEHLK